MARCYGPAACTIGCSNACDARIVGRRDESSAGVALCNAHSLPGCRLRQGGCSAIGCRHADWGAGSQPACMRLRPRHVLHGRASWRGVPKLDLQALLALPGVCDHWQEQQESYTAGAAPTTPHRVPRIWDSRATRGRASHRQVSSFSAASNRASLCSTALVCGRCRCRRRRQLVRKAQCWLRGVQQHALDGTAQLLSPSPPSVQVTLLDIRRRATPLSRRPLPRGRGGTRLRRRLEQPTRPQAQPTRRKATLRSRVHTTASRPRSRATTPRSRACRRGPLAPPSRRALMPTMWRRRRRRRRRPPSWSTRSAPASFARCAPARGAGGAGGGCPVQQLVAALCGRGAMGSSSAPIMCRACWSC